MRVGVEVSGGCGVELYLELWADFMAQDEDDFGVHLKIIALRCVPSSRNSRDLTGSLIRLRHRGGLSLVDTTKGMTLIF